MYPYIHVITYRKILQFRVTAVIASNFIRENSLLSYECSNKKISKGKGIPVTDRGGP
jgi:hypothetical protein